MRTRRSECSPLRVGTGLGEPEQVRVVHVDGEVHGPHGWHHRRVQRDGLRPVCHTMVVMRQQTKFTNLITNQPTNQPNPTNPTQPTQPTNQPARMNAQAKDELVELPRVLETKAKGEIGRHALQDHEAAVGRVQTHKRVAGRARAAGIGKANQELRPAGKGRCYSDHQEQQSHRKHQIFLVFLTKCQG